MNNPMPPQTKQERDFVDLIVRMINCIMDLLWIPVTPQRQLKMLRGAKAIMRGRNRELVEWIEKEIRIYTPLVVRGLLNI
jgi:hypothetical protein